MKNRYVVLVLIALVLCTCKASEVTEKGDLRPSTDLTKKTNYSEVHRKLVEQASKKCGVLQVDGKQPFFNVTGRLTSWTNCYYRPQTTVVLWSQVIEQESSSHYETFNQKALGLPFAKSPQVPGRG